ncbi:hypothetical protein TTHERM_00526740 (macronuclear) [Tetrahymena thermophila SB210]|uniref:Uncharacterized protein n=1 Tax=Tetrahymena thermophila (strain SB210) TaxID=312017 RepID=I7MN37_TETTS|nr:hypothetical protein TTHERM_00526740 [Tetrahymena thermophila SB210]EAS07843.1 hypothetical protein TTHERM_00526740 [Tetrahymena thermophila SB210]|eukprot:XP_001028085.1 hypothetical protein TTHERM_00526740 [Tetrahymena thermophila SB210]
MNSSILQNLNQNNNEQIHTDNEYSSSRISFQDQKKIFDFYDSKFGKEGLVGDHDDEILDNLAVQEQQNVKNNGDQNDILQIQNQMSIIQKENHEQKIENCKNIYFKPFATNFSYQYSNEQNKFNLDHKLTFFFPKHKYKQYQITKVS